MWLRSRSCLGVVRFRPQLREREIEKRNMQRCAVPQLLMSRRRIVSHLRVPSEAGMQDASKVCFLLITSP
jgi:hypothetical protein